LLLALCAFEAVGMPSFSHGIRWVLQEKSERNRAFFILPLAYKNPKVKPTVLVVLSYHRKTFDIKKTLSSGFFYTHREEQPWQRINDDDHERNDSCMWWHTYRSDWCIAPGTLWHEFVIEILLAIKLSISFLEVIRSEEGSAFTALKMLRMPVTTQDGDLPVLKQIYCIVFV
jgi:hypothetical protein